MKVFIIGKGASGKDYLSDYIQQNTDLVKAKMHTTRPIREKELNNPLYHHTNDLFFSNNPSLLYYEYFVGYYYGVTIKEFEKSDYILVTPVSIEKLYRENDLVIFLDIDFDTRVKRMQSRNDFDDSIRRATSDDKDFNNFDISIYPNHIHITNNIFDAEKILDRIVNI